MSAKFPRGGSIPILSHPSISYIVNADDTINKHTLTEEELTLKKKQTEALVGPNAVSYYHHVTTFKICSKKKTATETVPQVYSLFQTIILSYTSSSNCHINVFEESL